MTSNCQVTTRGVGWALGSLGRKKSCPSLSLWIENMLINMNAAFSSRFLEICYQSLQKWFVFITFWSLCKHKITLRSSMWDLKQETCEKEHVESWWSHNFGFQCTHHHMTAELFFLNYKANIDTAYSRIWSQPLPQLLSAMCTAENSRLVLVGLHFKIKVLLYSEFFYGQCCWPGFVESIQLFLFVSTHKPHVSAVSLSNLNKGPVQVFTTCFYQQEN